MAVMISGLWVAVVAAFVRRALPTDVMSAMASCVMAATVMRASAMAASNTVAAAGMSPRLTDDGEQQRECGDHDQ